MSYAETKIETGVPAQFLSDARRLEKKWELADGPRPVAEVLGSGTTGFENLGEFLGKRKSEAITYKVDSLVGPAAIEKILGTTTNSDLDFVAAQVNNMSMLQAYDTFLGIYMSPNGAFTDINFRLGKVSKTLLKNKESSQVNSDGSIYTRSNFHKKFNYQVLRAYGGYGGYAYQAQYNTGLYYANMFFPPYASPNEPSKSFLSTYIQAWNRSSRNGTSNGSWMSYSSYLKNSHKYASNENLHFDTSNFTLKRDGAFTYRHAGFKSINDNIMFLQWVLENTTGIVSSYLTEWDMSVYFQEGFIPNKDNQKLSLLYRIEDDNPMKDYPSYNKYADDANNLNYLTFGVVNAATSLETTNLKWNIDKFPMSRYWTQYPMTYLKRVSYGDDYEEQMALVNSPIISEMEKAVLKAQIALETQTEYYPDFYERGSLNPGMLFSGAPIMDKIEYCDRRGAALSGWWSWNMYYYKSLFVIPGVELSDLDANNMLSDANNVYDVAQANQEQGSGDSGTGAGSCYGTSSGGGSKWYKKKKPSSGSAGASKANAAGNRYVSSAVYTGTQDKVLSDSSNDNQAGAETFDEAKSLQYSSSTGLSDNNPVFYGGPHGASRSPKNPKSFFEINNVLMRNTPRIDPPESFDSKDLKAYLSGLNQFYSYKARTGSDELAESHRVKGVSENSFVGGLSLLKNGVQEKRWMLSMKRVKRYTNVQSDWWWWGWWWWGRHNRWQDNYPTHVYTHNGNNLGWQRLYYDSAWCWHGWRWGNNISGYDLNDDGRPDYARSNWWWHWGGGNRRAYYWTYEWGWGERYMLHGEPYTQWEMKEITYNQYTVSIPFQTLSYWFSIFRRYRAQANAYVRAIGPSRKKIELTGTGYWAMERSFGNWPKQTVRWTSGTTRIMNWFVKNSRELGTPNYLIFMAGENIFRSGGMAYPDAIFRAPVSMKEYSFAYSYNARDRRHKCHRHDCIHQSVGWREYIDVDLFSDDSVPFALMSTSQNAWTNLYSRDVFEDLAPTGNARQYNDIYQLFNGGTLRGCGIYSSIQGFNPNLEELEGTNYHALLDGSRYSNSRFCDVRFNYFSINNYAIAPRNTYGGFSYYPIGGVEKYSSNWMPYAQSQALMRGMLTAGLYVATRNEAYLCWGDAPFRVLYAQLANQVQFYRIAKDAILSETVLPASNIRQMLLRCVDPRVIKVSCKSYSTYDNEDSRYNYWIERAFMHFDKTPSVVSEYMARIRAELDSVIASYTSYLDVLKPLVSKHVMCWTYNEYYQAIMEYLPAIKAGVQGDLMFDEFFYCYLNILYEYRKYFINKRFNKVDGTFYQLRHLEGMLAYMKASTSTGDMPKVDFSGDTQATDIPVSFYTINHTPEQKTKALLSGNGLKPDEILKLYVPVTYSTEARYLKELARRESDPAHVMAVVKTKRTDPAKKYAEVPMDGTYQLISDQYKKNENNKKVNKVITEKYLAQEVDASQIALVTVANPDYSQLIRDIKWGDSQSLTPIEEDIAVNINASALVDALQVTRDIHAAVCTGRARERRDFWTVNVASSNCQTRGYKTGLVLVPYVEDKGSVGLTIEESAMGINANQLWPISEEQAQITTMASPSEQLKKMIGTGLKTGEEFFG